MHPNASTRRRLHRALFAAALLVFAASAGPIGLLMAACSMPCCQSVPMAGCGSQCGIGSAPPSTALPDVVVVATIATAQLTVVSTQPPRVDVIATESRPRVPDSAPLYLRNATFLI